MRSQSSIRDDKKMTVSQIEFLLEMAQKELQTMPDNEFAIENHAWLKGLLAWKKSQ